MSIDEVRALVAERQRYDDWLQALDARRAETPERVFQRVRADYGQRRDDVLARLHTHVDGLASLSNELGARLLQLDAEVESLEDRRVEAMLRTAVGEYDGSTWDSLRDEVEAQLTRLTDERGSVQMELDEMRALLEQARPAEPAQPAHDTPATDVATDVTTDVATDVTADVVTDVAATRHDEPVEAVPVEAARVETDEPIDVATDIGAVTNALLETEMVEEAVVEEAVVEEVDVVLFDESVAPDGSASFAESPWGHADGRPEVASAEIPLFFDAPAGDVDDALRLFAETPPAAAPVVPPPAEPVGFTAPELPPPPSTPPSVRAVAPASPAPAQDPFDDLAFLRSVTEPEHGGTSTDPLRAGGAVPGIAAAAPASAAPHSAADAPQKTLRCTECGTMNLPTEWYCERCGGELATF